MGFSRPFDEFLLKMTKIYQFRAAKVFIPWDCAKVFSKAFCPMGEKALQQASIIVVFYLANPYKNTTARSLFGMQRFCYIPWESFHPTGLRPLGCCKTFTSQTMIVQ